MLGKQAVPVFFSWHFIRRTFQGSQGAVMWVFNVVPSGVGWHGWQGTSGVFDAWIQGQSVIHMCFQDKNPFSFIQLRIPKPNWFVLSAALMNHEWEATALSSGWAAWFVTWMLAGPLDFLLKVWLFFSLQCHSHSRLVHVTGQSALLMEFWPSCRSVFFFGCICLPEWQRSAGEVQDRPQNLGWKNFNSSNFSGKLSSCIQGM